MIFYSSAPIKFAVDATKKALDDLESRRPKRDADPGDADPEDMDRRLKVLRNSASRFKSLRSNLTKIMNTVKSRLSEVRDKLSE